MLEHSTLLTCWTFVAFIPLHSFQCISLPWKHNIFVPGGDGFLVPRGASIPFLNCEWNVIVREPYLLTDLLFCTITDEQHDYPPKPICELFLELLLFKMTEPCGTSLPPSVFSCHYVSRTGEERPRAIWEPITGHIQLRSQRFPTPALKINRLVSCGATELSSIVFCKWPTCLHPFKSLLLPY